jgi:hypothetical protein
LGLRKPFRTAPLLLLFCRFATACGSKELILLAAERHE